ncbi:AI-2E family transporter [Anditalea andensis]|uniref:Permease n=1 Tax=Anditalea andensis TaxID=1048983 RepID=A0A074L3D6_9BACT|nr:AI-2E family transporter [Anditalea andensis]KEO75664.1 hypothetical protein EL17_23890 [Anditalea andensis]
MENKLMRILLYFTLVSLGLTSFFWGIIMAQGFLAPLVVAVLLMMVILPIARWMEKRSVQRGWASFFSTFIILLFFITIAGVVGLQVKKFTEQWPDIQRRLQPNIELTRNFVEDKTGMEMQIPQFLENSGSEEAPIKNEAENAGSIRNPNPQDIPQSGTAAQEQETGTSSPDHENGSMIQKAGGYALSFFGFLGSFMLTFIYVFFFLLYRNKFKQSILKMTPDNSREKVKEIISQSLTIAQNYLFGRLLLIIFLAIIYAIGLSISGVEQPILISVLAAVLSLMPYIGNVIGYGLAVSMAFISGSGMPGVLGVTVTFSIAQFVESYILEPYVVGEKVNINPVFTIIIVVLGGAVWGIVGMLVAIPVLAILKVVFDHIPTLSALGYLFGEEDLDDGDDDRDGFFSKLKNKLTGKDAGRA